jgi:hypothetical protein
MADSDVKVKFSGDFSDVPKGADAAVQKAGSAMSGWFGDFSKSIGGQIAGIFAFTHVIGKMKEAFEKFRGLDDMSKKLNINVVDLQKLTKVGVEYGISMDSIAMGMSKANILMGKASNGNVAAAKTLHDLGVTQEEINSGHLTAIDLMYKLAESYEKNHDHNKLAAAATAVFSRAGKEMVGVLKEGSAALRERIGLMKVFSEEEVRSGARTAREIERAEKTANKWLYQKPAGGYAKVLSRIEAATMVIDATKEAGLDANSVTGIGSSTAKEALTSPGKMSEITKNLIKQGKREGWTTEDLANAMGVRAAGAFRSEEQSDFYSQIQGMLLNKAQEEEAAKNKKPGASGPTVSEAFGVSSLQAIGGGDLGSIMTSAAGGNAALDAAEQTANNTKEIASKMPNPLHPQPAANAAK